MNTHLKMAGTCAFLLLLAAAPAPREDLPRWEKLQAVVSALPKITSLKARFRQERTSALLAEPAVSSGLFAARGVRSKWDTQGENPSVMAVDAGDGKHPGTLKIYYPTQKTLEIYPLDARFAAAMAGPSPDLSLLRGHFFLATLADDGKAQLLTLVMTPLSKKLRAHVAKVVAVMDAKTGCLKSLAMFDPEGESTTAVFTDVQVNPEIKDADLRLDAPADVKTVYPAGKVGAAARRVHGEGDANGAPPIADAHSAQLLLLPTRRAAAPTLESPAS